MSEMNQALHRPEPVAVAPGTAPLERRPFQHAGLQSYACHEPSWFFSGINMHKLV